MLIDTHCHLDSDAFDLDRAKLIGHARSLGLTDALICAGFPGRFEKTASIAKDLGLHYALGVHPLCMEHVPDEGAFLAGFESLVRSHLDDPAFVAIGEIGLDGYVEGLPWDKQLRLFRGQLKVAHRLNLPVSIHARHAVDSVTKELREVGCVGGVVHAFNGSMQQAKRLLSLGLKLGFGGAMTYTGSLRIRRILSELGNSDFVLETDAPDIPSAWRRESAKLRTEPADIVQYADIASEIRHSTAEAIQRQSTENAIDAFPRLRNRD